MYNLVNSNFNRTYNPSGRQNALSDIKRLLTSRDVAAQSKACGYLIEVVSRYSYNSEERARMIEYLLDNDITVFLCEATSNLDFTLFRSITTCLRLVWRTRRFFSEEHAAHALGAGLRALAHYAGSGPQQAVDACMHFLCDLLNGISFHQTAPALSHQSAYSTAQVLACLGALPAQLPATQNTILAGALVLDALISYQPHNLILKGSTASALVEVLRQWFELAMGALQHALLGAGAGAALAGMLYVVLCQLGIHALKLTKVLWRGGGARGDFVQSILADEQEASALTRSAQALGGAVRRLLTHLLGFTKEHQTQIATEEYGLFLKFLLSLFYDGVNEDDGDGALADICDVLLNRGYLTMLPQVQVVRNDPTVRKASTLVLGELLKVLAAKYLNVENVHSSTCANDIHMGLVELQYGIEQPHSIGTQLQKGQPYSLLIYIYFYCQSSENPKEATAPLLPSLVEHILRLPSSFQPPPYIIKALWLVFAMSTISNTSSKSLEERVYLEKATERLVVLLQPDASVFYSHHPALLLWAFASPRIPDHVRFHVVCQWLKFEDSLPTELISEAPVWEILLNILVQCREQATVEHCVETVRGSVDELDDDVRDDLSNVVWGMLPEVLSQALVDDNDTHVGSNICYFLELASTLLPDQLDSEICSKTALFVAFILAKDKGDLHDRNTHLEYLCLKLSLHLLGLAHNQNDNRILLTYMNRHKCLASVLAAATSAREQVACAALQLLSYVVHYFTRYGYQPSSVLQLQTHLIIESLRRARHSELGASLLQLVYIVLNSGPNAPLALAYDVETPAVERQSRALRALMFRIQLMLCCRVQDNKSQSSAGWKTLSSIFKHAIYSKNDTKLTAALTSQPWTHTLVQFQLTQDVTPEFLAFLHSWLTLLKTTVERNQQQRRVAMSRHSIVIKTMLLLKKELKVEAMEDGRTTGEKILYTVREILRDSGLGISL